MAGLLEFTLVGLQVPLCDRWRNERGRHEDQATAGSQMASGLSLELTDGMHPHRHLVVEGDPAGFDAGVVGELAGHRIAKPAVLQFPLGLVQRNGCNAEAGVEARSGAWWLTCVHRWLVSRRKAKGTAGVGGSAAGAGLWRSAAAGASQKLPRKTDSFVALAHHRRPREVPRCNPPAGGGARSGQRCAAFLLHG